MAVGWLVLFKASDGFIISIQHFDTAVECSMSDMFGHPYE